MNTARIICIVLLVGFFSSSLKAQMSKAEERQLLEELKALQKDPYQLKQMKREYDDLENNILQKEKFLESQNAINETLLDQLGRKDSAIFSLRNLVIQMENRTLTSGPDSATGSSGIDITRPTLENAKAYFRVQIGAYRNRKLAKSLKANYKFITEQGNDGLKKYLIGDFRSYDEAKKLTQYLTRKGAQAFVVGYLDNKRLNTLRLMPKEYL